MKFAQELIQLGEELSAQNVAAHDLWTWLPSYKVAERYHGDYASEHCPSNRDVMIEAALHINYLRHPERELTPDDREWFEKCPCGEDH